MHSTFFAIVKEEMRHKL